jgi:hypothetical protein
MAQHTFPHGRNTGRSSGITSNVAIEARQPELHMRVVRKLNRLLLAQTRQRKYSVKTEISEHALNVCSRFEIKQ